MNIKLLAGYGAVAILIVSLAAEVIVVALKHRSRTQFHEIPTVTSIAWEDATTMPPSSDPPPEPYKFGVSTRASFKSFFDVMEKSGHRTSWQSGPLIVGDQNGEVGKIFMFVSFDNATADRAQSVLQEAGLLCSTPLAFKMFDDDGTVTVVPMDTWRGPPWEEQR
jgi:hypothetical protein